MIMQVSTVFLCYFHYALDSLLIAPSGVAPKIPNIRYSFGLPRLCNARIGYTSTMLHIRGADSRLRGLKPP